MSTSGLDLASGVVQALISDGPDPAYADKLMAFGRLVGEWDFEWTGFDADGRVQRAKGEWLFAWALNGRAVIDIWINPSRAQREEGDDRVGEWGVTVRCYDPAIDAWRVSWSGPVYGNLRTFVATPGDDRIVMEGADDQGRRVQWIFSEMSSDSFHWRSFLWGDDETPPRVREEMFVRRRISEAAPARAVEVAS